ncbi:hypothetical protein [Parasitella parasitica]|uniref:PHD-type domain-containing protein n=1 Tax=Parasitella parasitica TaxID=35722 RepID=A0A0B7N8Y0_9FUNG|nr:hypothetical protein [Parasitella parasitica]
MKLSNPENDMYARSASPDLREIKRKLNLATDSRHRQCKSADYQSTNTQKKSLAEANKKNHDLCDACGGAGQFLCCDACPNAFHLTCVEPPMDAEDLDKLSDNWYCNECEHKKMDAKKSKSKKAKSKSKFNGVFNDLIVDIEWRNPIEYRLPDHIINFFENVAADKEGDYHDTSTSKRVRYKHGEMEQPDYYQLKDKSGEFILCYQCRKTALKKPMIGCDFCTLHWHLDCLSPPMASPPNPSKKWRCPNHIEHIIKPPRRQKKQTIIYDKLPSRAYHNYITNVIDDSPKAKRADKEKQVQKVRDRLDTTDKKKSKHSLPSENIVMDFAAYTKKAIEGAMKRKTNTTDRRQSIPSTLTSSSSEVSTPPTAFTSPTTSHKPISHPPYDNKNEIDNWLQNMAYFQAGENHQHYANRNNDKVESIIEKVKKSIPTSSSNKKRKKIDSEKYKLYVQIENLLQQKSNQELYNLLSN